MDDQYLIGNWMVVSIFFYSNLQGIDPIDQHIIPQEIISILEFSFHAPNMAES